MNEQTKQDEYVEIDLQRIVGALWHKIWIVILAAVVIAVITFVVCFQFVPKQYQSAARFYVNNSDINLSGATVDISSADITASRDLVESYITILEGWDMLRDIRSRAGVSCSLSELNAMIEAQAVNETEIFEVVVTSKNPDEAHRICKAIEECLPKKIDDVILGATSITVDQPTRPTTHSAPNYRNCTIIGFAIGFVLMAMVVILQEVFDITIRSEEDMQQICKHPVLASVPDMGAPSKGGYYYYGYGSKRRSYAPKKNTAAAAPVLFGGNISFAASEAYKLLRTKLQFSFVDEKKSRVIGFSSALSGEGKSLSAVNLAYTLSQLDKKVILIDCDMRRPTLADKLGVNKIPGLSGYLTGQHEMQDMIQNCNLKNEEDAFQVIAAGQNPPNPVELLSSEKMTKFLTILREKYDYVILDLPPVGEVSDAMAVAKETDGMLLVVRQNYCDRVVLKDAVRQFEFIDAKILGVVYNCTTENSGRYGKGYYKRYYRRYYRSYYGRAHRRYEGAYLKKNTEKSTDEKK